MMAQLASESVLERLDSILGQAATVDFGASEETGALHEIVSLRPRILDLLDQGAEALREVEELFEAVEAQPQPDPQASDTLADIGVMISTEMAVQGLADLAYIARSDLRTCGQDLRAASDGDLWRQASLLDRALRRLRRGLISVESAICEFEGREAPLRFWGDLETSLEVRRVYGKLRREVGALEPVSQAELVEAFEQLAGRFANLRAEDLYPLLRIGDRREIRRLHGRIADWLQGPERDDPSSGRRLWQDATAFVSLLSAVNLREELRQHDRRLVGRAFHSLFGRRGVSFLSETLLEEMRSLLGLDDELDELLLNPDQHPLAAWRTPLERLRSSLSGGKTVTPWSRP